MIVLVEEHKFPRASIMCDAFSLFRMQGIVLKRGTPLSVSEVLSGIDCARDTALRASPLELFAGDARGPLELGPGRGILARRHTRLPLEDNLGSTRFENTTGHY